MFLGGFALAKGYKTLFEQSIVTVLRHISPDLFLALSSEAAVLVMN